MKDLLFKTSFSKIYMLSVILISLMIIGSYFSFAMFTVTKEKNNAISIVTGNLSYKLEVDGEEGNTLTVPPNTVKEFTITLSNPNNREARFNFYYVGGLPSNVTAGYKVEEDTNIPPSSIGTNLEKVDTTSSSNVYKIIVANASSNEITITLGIGVGLDYNNLNLPSNGHLFNEYQGFLVSEVTNYYGTGDVYNDGINTFITGEEPNNYIWYSGKLWRAVSVNNEARTTKLVTQWNISAINYSSGSSSFGGSYIEDWLNDTSVDGFLGNLREPENFIVIDAKWDATMDDRELGNITRPKGINIVTDAVGLLNVYEYQSSYHGTTYSNGYLNNELNWWTLTSYSSSNAYYITTIGALDNYSSIWAFGSRPSINLKSSIRVVDGDGTLDNPFRLEGDNDTNLEGTYLNERFSGEYIRFGMGENNLYRIVSYENGTGTKIVSAEPLKDLDTGTFIVSTFGSNTTFSSSNTIGVFLNGEYLTNYVGNNYVNLIEDNTIWYLGAVGNGTSYKLAKYTDITSNIIISNNTISKIGLLRHGELMSGQFNIYDNNVSYWTLTPYYNSDVRTISRGSGGISALNNPLKDEHCIRPALNLKSNVIITSGDGTKDNPFKLA